MKWLLLDTHVFLWFMANDGQLPRATLRKIETAEEGIYLSVVSGLEIALKHSLGKLDLTMPFLDLITEGLRLRSIESLPIRPLHL